MASVTSKKRIAIIVRTNGLQFDDRVRKEALSLRQEYDVHIFVLLSSNEVGSGVTDYGVPFTTISLMTRRIFKSSKFLLLKALEFYLRTAPLLKDFDILWAHEEYTFLFPLLSGKKIKIWDLHEIPSLFERGLLKKVFHLIERRTNLFFHANEYRIEYLRQNGVITAPDKHLYLRNYPDASFIQSTKKAPDWEQITNFIQHGAYIYLQGISTDNRFGYNSISSLLENTDFNIVVVGGSIEQSSSEKLIDRFGQEYEKRVFFTGMLPQDSTPIIISGAVFSMVFYAATRPNWRYCEPNRFFQCLALGVPVICGANEPMASMINKYQVGVAIQSYGEKEEDIQDAIFKMIKQAPLFRENSKKMAGLLTWKSEEEKLLENLKGIVAKKM